MGSFLSCSILVVFFRLPLLAVVVVLAVVELCRKMITTLFEYALTAAVVYSATSVTAILIRFTRFYSVLFV